MITPAEIHLSGLKKSYFLIEEIKSRGEIAQTNDYGNYTFKYDASKDSITVTRTVNKEGQAIIADEITFPIYLVNYSGAEKRIFKHKTTLLEDPFNAELAEDQQWIQSDFQTVIGVEWIHNPERTI